MKAEWANDFAAEWIDSWNAHDLDRVLTHDAESVEFFSPFVPQVLGEPSGRVHGKSAGNATNPNRLVFDLFRMFTLVMIEHRRGSVDLCRAAM
jgi:hypothetical protein